MKKYLVLSLIPLLFLVTACSKTEEVVCTKTVDNLKEEIYIKHSDNKLKEIKFVATLDYEKDGKDLKTLTSNSKKYKKSVKGMKGFTYQYGKEKNKYKETIIIDFNSIVPYNASTLGLAYKNKKKVYVIYSYKKVLDNYKNNGFSCK